MANTVVGGAVVEITADLAAFTEETKAGLAESLGSTQMRDTVTAGMTKAASQVGEAGQTAGAEFTAATAEAIKAGSPATTAAAEESATEVGAASKEKMATEGAESGAAFKDGMLDNLKGLASAAVPLLGIFAGGELVKGALEAADQLEGANIKIENVFGESGDSVKKWASGVAANLRMSAVTAETTAGQFGAYLSGLGVGKEQAAGLSEQLTSLTANVAAFNNADPATVQAAITSALRGRTTALKQYGVTLTAAQINQEAMTHAAELGTIQMKDGQPVLNTQQKALATLYAVMDATKGQQGALAKTSDTLKAKQQILSAEFSNFMAMLGTYLLPVLAKLAGYILNDVVPALITAGRWIQQNQSWIKPLAEVVGLVVAAWIAWTLAVDAWQLVTKVATAVQAAFNAVMDANPIVLVVVALVALAAGFIYAYQHSATFRAIVQAALKDVKAAALDVANFFTKDIPAAFDKVTAFLRQWGPLILAVLLPFIGLPLLIMQHWSAITGFFSKLWSDIVGYFKTAVSWLKQAGMDIIDGLWTGIQLYWNDYVLLFYVNMPETIAGYFVTALQWLLQAGENVITGLWNGIHAVWNNEVTAFENIGSTVKGWFTGAVTWLDQAGQDLITGLFNGVKAIAGDVGSFITDIGQDIARGINTILGLPWKIPKISLGWGISVGGETLIPAIPLAAGATVLPSPGGTLTRLGEGGKAETVVDAGGMNKLVTQINARLDTGAGLTPSQGQNARPIQINQTIYQQPGQDPSSLAADSSRQIARSIQVAA